MQHLIKQPSYISKVRTWTRYVLKGTLQKPTPLSIFYFSLERKTPNCMLNVTFNTFYLIVNITGSFNIYCILYREFIMAKRICKMDLSSQRVPNHFWKIAKMTRPIGSPNTTLVFIIIIL